MKTFALLLMAVLSPALAWASGAATHGQAMDLTGTFYGWLGVIVFVMAYSLVPLENTIHLRKSKPVLLAAGIVWILVTLAYAGLGEYQRAHEAIKASLLEYAELFLFLLAAMTYINALEERNVFQSLRAYLVSRGLSLRGVFWITGALAFLISPVADNLTTALLMGAVVMAVGGSDHKFVALACINIVVAANAGGAFSPFGDITTLMVWQKGKVHFADFFHIFVPSLVNWLVPAICMHFAVAKVVPKALDEKVTMKYGAKVIMALFICTITTAVCFHNFLHLPPAAGMMLGLGYLGVCSFFIKRREGRMHMFDAILGTRLRQVFDPLGGVCESGACSREMLDEIEEPAFMIDRDHKIVFWNKAMEALTGVKSEDQIDTKRSYHPFYKTPRPSMADLVIDSMPEVQVEHFYGDKQRRSQVVDKAFEASDFFPSLGEKGKWVAFSAAPVHDEEGNTIGAVELLTDIDDVKKRQTRFDIMQRIARAEWDTLLFFYGVILCVGGLSEFGYLAKVSLLMYHDLGPTIANSMVGVLSAIIDNIPVMFAVLSMNPAMDLSQWLLVTLTAGVGGSMLAVGSAAGVALMGTARGVYTFGAHLKWTPVIAVGYVASILIHLWLNGSMR